MTKDLTIMDNTMVCLLKKNYRKKKYKLAKELHHVFI